MAEYEGLNVYPEKSSKLQELCQCLKTENVPFFYSKNNWSRNSRYQYYIICTQYTKPYNFPVFRYPPVSYASQQTTIYDEEARERIDIPLRAQVMVRIKGPRGGSAIQAIVMEGHVEVSDIRKVQIAAPVPDLPVLTLVCYLDPEEIRPPKPEVRFCPYCGSANRVSTTVCARCGNPL